MNRAPLTAIRAWVAVAAALVVATMPLSRSHAAAISAVVVEGDPAPGIPGATFLSITDPRATLNNAGQVAFAAELGGAVDPGNDQVIYRYSFGSGATLIARGLDPIPALPGLIYAGSGPRYAGPGSMNDSGEIAFYAEFGLGQSALFSNGSVVVQGAGTGAPGLPGITVGALSNDARTNNAGQVLYTVRLAGVPAANNTVLYRANTRPDVPITPASSITPIAREGDIAPGTSDAFGEFANVSNARINASGQVAFTAPLTGGGNAVYVYRDTPVSGLALLARNGALAPGASGEFFSGSGFASVRINKDGQVAFLATLSNGDRALYIDTSLYARDNMAAPGIPVLPGLPGLTLLNVGGAPSSGRVELNDHGVPLFVSGLLGPGVTEENNSVVYLGMDPIARTGSASPIAGASFGSFNNFDLALNNLNQVALIAQLTGTGISPANDLALMMWDGSNWHVVAREGDPLAGSLIDELVGGGNPRIELNDASQVLFWANLADGRDGLFVTAAIPEPEMVWSFLAGLAVLGFQLSRGRRHRRA